MKHRRNERGVALIICLFALMLLSGIGLGMMYMSDTETSINSNYRDSQQAYFAASAGLQEVRERLMPTSASAFTAAQKPTKLPANNDPAGVTYVLNWGNGVAKASIAPWDSVTNPNPYFDYEFCKESFVNGAGPASLVVNPGQSQPCTAVPTGIYYTAVDSTMPGTLGANANLPYRWVRVTLKANNTAGYPSPYYVSNPATTLNNVPICWSGTSQLPKPAGYVTCDDDPPPDGITYYKTVYVLTALAVAPGGSRRIVQMEVANNPPLVTNAALDTNDFVTVSGSSVTVNGYDNCKCVCVPGVGSAPPTCTNRTTGGACTGNTYAVFSSQSVSTSGNPALVSGVTTCAPGNTGCSNPSVAYNQQPFPYDVPSLISKYANTPGVINTTQAPYNISCTPPSSPGAYSNCGTLTTGSLGTLPTGFPTFDPNNPIGAVYQTTYVPGSFDIQAQTTGSGVLIVDGDLTIHGGLQFYGLIIVRGVLTFSGSGQGQGANVIGAMLTGNGSVADSLAGGINIQYDRCALLHNQNPQPPALLATHEASY